MSILSVDQISPIGTGTTITLNATEVKTGTEITVGTGASIFSPAGNTLVLGTNNAERLRITNDGTLQLGGNLDANGHNIFLDDGNKLHIGNLTSSAGDLQLHHVPADNFSYIDTWHHLAIRKDNGAKTHARFINNAQVELYYNDAKKIETTDTGAVVTGICTATTFEATTFSKTPTNTPAFHAYRDPSISPSISDATNTKITFLTHETLDTDSAYDNSSSGTTANRFTVPSGKGGYYNVSAGINFYANNNDIRHARIFIQKNGNTAITAYGMVGSYFAGLRHFQCNLNGILNLSAGDYLELYAYLDVNSNTQAYISNDQNGLRGNHFSAYKLII